MAKKEGKNGHADERGDGIYVVDEQGGRAGNEDRASSSPPHLVVVAGSRMSVAEYDAERARLRELYGENTGEAAAKYDQTLALLFARSNWTQEELGKREGKSQRHIGRQLQFGRFLNFRPSGSNFEIPANLTERGFRKLWERTDKKSPKEEYRFRAVIELLGFRPAVRRSRASARIPNSRDKCSHGNPAAGEYRNLKPTEDAQAHATGP